VSWHLAAQRLTILLKVLPDCYIGIATVKQSNMGKHIIDIFNTS